MIQKTIQHIPNEIVTVPNFITASGIIIILLYAYCFSWGVGEAYIPFLVFAAGCSDLLDGLAARMLNQHSRLGKILDPVRDRLLGAAILINIVITNPAAWGIVTLVCLFESAIAAIHFSRMHTTGALTHTHFSGKIRQAIHLIAAGVFVSQTYMPLWTAMNIPPIPAITIVFTMFTATVYAFTMQVVE